MKVYRHAVIVAALLLICTTAVATPDATCQAQLEHLPSLDCGACHGLHMTGGLGPELTPTALALQSSRSPANRCSSRRGAVVAMSPRQQEHPCMSVWSSAATSIHGMPGPMCSSAPTTMRST
ncbi:hypothetical protein PS928_00580 [Pseudomonas fluorescens]|jgi:hypothetical protein|uniref:Cytochrome c domain-containing protein n=1 Tax=Pseudomonas fluorescens TaxID=294 RepID=A0A5E7S8K2_PSEFL|nr:hypothetical protein PS928_00580 [Pseudomonas fluorescens]